MARHASAVKAARQSEKRRNRNRSVRSECRTAVKALEEAVAKGKSGVGREALTTSLSRVQKLLMKAAAKNVFKSKTVSRKVGRLSRSINKVTA